MAKILVADDNSNIQKMVGLALKDQGIEVVAVGNGEAAVRKIVYTRAAMNPQRGPSAGPTAYIDPSSPEVQELKSAALPLLMRLNDQQKREVSWDEMVRSA